MVEMSSSFRPGFVPKTICDFLDEVSSIADAPEKMSKLDDFVIRLEVEMKKIDAFKRELPLCALLLNDAISALKESLRCESEKAQPHLVEFIRVKREFDESDDSDSDKKNWMKSVQLWHSDDTLEYATKAENKRNENESCLSAVDMLPTRAKWSEEGKRFMPRFMPVKASSLVADGKGEEEERPIQGLSFLGAADIKDRTEKSSSSVVSITSENDDSSSWHVKPNVQLGQKQRRCWSAELHELFVSSLQKLGGAKVATPKNIRDLMQIDGLTNDEVKSHLQKYRLHIQRVSRTDQSLSRSHSGSPQGPLQLGATAKISIGGGESFEDAKFDSFSWKTHFHRI